MSQTITLPLNQTATRVSSIDVLRGIVMVIMALDHTRDFFHLNGFFYEATDMTTTTPALFFTRWITHFCAPTFVFLAGTSAYLSGRKKTASQLSLFLLSRGIWLIFLELTIVNFSIWFDVTFSGFILQVIWAIGFSMVVLSGLVFLPKKGILCIGLLIVAGHNALDGVSLPRESALFLPWALLHQPTFLQITPHTFLGVFYPVLPWIGVMCLGYCFGTLYSSDFNSERRKQWLLRLGVGVVAAFVAIRMLNVYGDPSHWAVQKNGLYTCMSFLNTTKYPPSLLYVLMTLGPGMLLLYALEGKRQRWLDFFTVFGRVPLFYYVLHFYLIHAAAILSMVLIEGTPWSSINFQNRTGGIPQGHGFSLGATYLVWLSIVLILYPACRWYSRFKSGKKSPVWSYL